MQFQFFIYNFFFKCQAKILLLQIVKEISKFNDNIII